MTQKLFIFFIMVTAVAALPGCSKKFKMSRDSLVETSPWQYHRQDRQSTAAISGTFNGKLSVIWEHSTGTRPSGPLSLAKGVLVYPGSKKKIRIYSPSDGHNRGFLRTKGHTSTGLTVQDSLGIYVDGPRSFVLRCLNLLNRNTVWTRSVKDAAAGSIILNDMVILSQTQGIVQSFDIFSGQVNWTFKMDERLIAPPTVFENRIYQTGDRGTLYIINAETGEEARRIELNEPLLSATAVSGYVYLIDMPGNIYAISKSGDSIIWQNKIDGPVWSSPAVGDNKIFVTGNTGTLTALNAQSGEIQWSFDAVEVIKSSPIVVGQYVIFGTMYGNLYALDSETGRVISKREFSGAISQSPVSDGRFIYVATSDGEIVCLGDTSETAASANN